MSDKTYEASAIDHAGICIWSAFYATEKAAKRAASLFAADDNRVNLLHVHVCWKHPVLPDYCKLIASRWTGGKWFSVFDF